MVVTRDPVAYRLKQKAKRSEEWERQKQEAIRANRKARAIKKAEQIKTCYREYTPVQIRLRHVMVRCTGSSPVFPVRCPR